jgi:hypothetical protein
MRPQIRLSEGIAVLGLTAGVVGYGLKMADLPGKDYVTVVGLALFLVGIVLSLRDIQSQLKEQRDEHAILLAHRIVAEAGAHRAVDPGTIFIRATCDVIRGILSDYIPNVAQSLKRHVENPSVEIVVADKSPVFDLMYRLGDSLPDRCVWMGITLLESPAAWEAPIDDRFVDFRDLMRRRAKEKQLNVLRLYYFQTPEAFTRMKPQLEVESANGIKVKYLIGGEEPPPDISLLWLPPRNGTARSSTWTDAPTASARSLNYVPLCLLVYATRVGALLTSLNMSAGNARSFAIMENRFSNFWSRATPLGH